MPLERQNVAVPFVGGLETKQDPKTVPPAKLLSLVNGTFAAPGKLKKRNGYKALGSNIVSPVSGDDIGSGLAKMIIAGLGQDDPLLGHRYDGTDLGYYLLTYVGPAAQTLPAQVTQGNLATFGGELVSLAGDGQNLLSYSPDASGWVSKGPFVPTSLTETDVFRHGTAALGGNPEAAFDPTTGIQLFTWLSNGSIYYSAVDTSTGAQLVSNALAVNDGNISFHRCVYWPATAPWGGGFVITWVNGNGQIMALPLFSASIQNVGLQVLIDHGSVALIGNKIETIVLAGGELVIGWTSSNTFNARCLLPLANLGTAGATHITNTTTGIGSFSLFPLMGGVSAPSGYFALAYQVSTTTLGVKIFSAGAGFAVGATVPISDTVTSIVGVSKSSSTVSGVVFFTTNASSELLIKKASFNGDSLATKLTVGTPTTVIRSLAAQTRPWVVNGTAYLAALSSCVQEVSGQTRGAQDTYFVIDENGNAVAKFLYGAGPTTYLLGATSYQPSSVAMPTASSVLLPLLKVTSLGPTSQTTFVGGVQVTNVIQVTVNGVTAGLLTYGTTPIAQEFAGNLLISGGMLWQYDGQSVVEHGFHLWPEEVTTTTSAGSGFSYNYVALYSWMDAKGQMHRSAPSISQPLTVVVSNAVSGAHSINVTVPMLRVTAKKNVMIEIYRTQNNGTQYFLVSSLTNPIANDPTKTNFSFTDSTVDASLTSNLNLYTGQIASPSQVENIAPDAVSDMCVWRNRMVLLDAENPFLLWYSQPLVDGVPPQFSDLLQLELDARGGKCNAIASMDDKLFIFKDRSIQVLVGNGPDVNGNNSDYGPPTEIAVDVGCQNPLSKAVCPKGILFQAGYPASATSGALAGGGIYLCDRSLSISYLGAPVEAYNYGSLLGATLVAGQRQVRFLHSAGTLVYDYLMDQWSVFDFTAQSAVVWQGLYTCMNGPYAMQETPGIFVMPNGAFYSMSLTTAWIQVAGMQGFQRLRKMNILGDYASPHALTVSVAYNYNPAIVQTDTIQVPASIVPYQKQIHFARQLCQAVSITLSDGPSEQGAFGEGAAFTGITVEVAVKRGIYKLPASQQAG